MCPRGESTMCFLIKCKSTLFESQDFHYLIFGSNYDDEVGEMHVNKLLCLPVTVQELIRKDRGAVTVSSPIL